jgi:hypothetical protein
MVRWLKLAGSSCLNLNFPEGNLGFILLFFAINPLLAVFAVG